MYDGDKSLSASRSSGGRLLIQQQRPWAWNISKYCYQLAVVLHCGGQAFVPQATCGQTAASRHGHGDKGAAVIGWGRGLSLTNWFAESGAYVGETALRIKIFYTAVAICLARVMFHVAPQDVMTPHYCSCALV